MSDSSVDMMEKITRYLQEFEDEWTPFIRHLEDCIRELLNVAAGIDKFHKGATIASVTGSSFGIAGGITTIVGIALAPVTLGVSLIISGVGIGVAVAGGMAGAVASVADTVNIKKKCNRVEEIVADINSKLGSIEEVSEKIKNEIEALKLAMAAKRHQTFAQAGKFSGRTAFMAIEISRLVQLGRVTAIASRGAQLVAQGAQAARAITGVFAALFILVDAGFIIKGAVDLHKGARTEAAAEIRSIAEKLQETLSCLEKEDTVFKDEFERFITMLNTEDNRESKSLIPPDSDSNSDFDSFINDICMLTDSKQ